MDEDNSQGSTWREESKKGPKITRWYGDQSKSEWVSFTGTGMDNERQRPNDWMQ